MQLTLESGNVTLQQLEHIYRSNIKVTLASNCYKAVEQSHRIITSAVASDEAIYGVNTGFGKLANTRIAANDTATLQRNLILSHCAAVGEALPNNIVRLIMALKLISLGRGVSGVRAVLLQQIEDMLQHNILPVIPAQGSVGASGDLAPLAHMAAAMIGEGEVIYNNRRVSSSSALKKAGLNPIKLGPKEGLALINGTQVSTALALVGLFTAWHNLQNALISGALSTDSAMGSSSPFRDEIHAIRGHKGQIDAAYSLRAIMADSAIRESHRDDDERVQDPYCIRCQPQVMGACIDILRYAASTLQIEANAATDNPLIFSDGSILSGGNFHAEPVAFAADSIALAIAEIGSIAQRRIALMVDPTLSFGLPAFLSPNPGINSGFMIAEVTAAALMSENKQKAAPCSVDSTPTSANQEDHVSMACHAARRLQDMNDNLARIIAIEFLTAAQGVEFRAPLSTSPILQKVIAKIRSHIPPLQQDRYMSDDLEQAANMVKTGELLQLVDQALLPSLDI